MMNFILSQAWPYILGVAALVAGWFAARQSGKVSERSKQISDRIDSIKEAKSVHNQTSGMADSDITSDLKSKWLRNNKQ